MKVFGRQIPAGGAGIVRVDVEIGDVAHYFLAHSIYWYGGLV